MHAACLHSISANDICATEKSCVNDFTYLEIFPQFESVQTLHLHFSSHPRSLVLHYFSFLFSMNRLVSILIN